MWAGARSRPLSHLALRARARAQYDGTVLGRSGGGGEYAPQIGFGWTCGAALDLLVSFDFESLEEGVEGLPHDLLSRPLPPAAPPPVAPVPPVAPPPVPPLAGEGAVAAVIAATSEVVAAAGGAGEAAAEGAPTGGLPDLGEGGRSWGGGWRGTGGRRGGVA